MLTTAIMKVHTARPCIFEVSIECAAADASGTMRILLAKFRDVHKDLKSRETARARVSNNMLSIKSFVS
jgi:uncharacterized protein with von Willebrand factor type A (vWA) domain